MLPTLDSLMNSIDRTSAEPLERLSEASRIATECDALGDELLGVYVDRCRRAGSTWADIGEHIGVSRQAAQKRFGDGEESTSRDPVFHMPQEHHGKYRPLWEWLGKQR